MEDSKIVQLYWDRDQDAIRYTAKKYGNYCTAIAMNILGNMEDAEECVNDTYMNTWNSIPTNRPKMLSTFLGKITRNISFNRYKHNHADKRGGSEVPVILDELSECVSGVDDIEKEIECKELVKAINDFLASLPQEKRSIFICRYWYSDSITNIAKAYGMKENAVSMLLSRSRLKLHAYLTERGFKI
ncbi:MAG: RNA polymerase sigma factor [Lachnospiraceae bacterium]